MNLAFLGFAMIIVFMALIMAKKLSPFTSLILVPVAFGLLAGYGWETRVVDENGKDVKQGEVGELLLRGPGVMTCYYKDEKATADTLKDGWLYTGDMAKEDEDGFLFLVDRKKDVIISGGENLYPVQIEDFKAEAEEEVQLKLDV